MGRKRDEAHGVARCYLQVQAPTGFNSKGPSILKNVRAYMDKQRAAKPKPPAVSRPSESQDKSWERSQETPEETADIEKQLGSSPPRHQQTSALHRHPRVATSSCSLRPFFYLQANPSHSDALA